VFDTFNQYGCLYIGSFSVGPGAVAMALAFPPLPPPDPLQPARGSLAVRR
jgi:hypothetical protein